MAYQYGAVVSAGGQEAEALMPPYRSSSGDRTNTPGMWRSFLVVALALVVGALCGGLEAITEKSSSTTLGSAPLLNRDPNAGNQATGNQTAGNQTAALGIVSLGCPQSSTVKVKLSVHDALRAVGMSTTVVGIDIPNSGFSYNIKVPEIHGHGICTLIEMAESFEALIKERDLESVVKVIPGIGPAVDMLKDLVDDAKDLVQTAPKKLSKIKEIASDITDIPGALEKVAELVFESMFPINAGALTKIINDEFQSLLTTASVESSLGHDASSHDHPSTRNFLGNDERTVRSAVRAKIRATLRGDGKTVNTTVHHQMPPAALGDLSLGNICFKAPEINKALKLLESKELSYAMPWPVKLANDAFKPADFKLPVMKSETCIKLSFDGGLVDHQVAMDLIKVFLDFFKPIIFKGLKAVMKQIMGDAESILALVEPVINVVGHVEDGYDKVTGIFSKRKLLSDEDNDDDASRRSDALKNVLEERLLHKSMELRRALIADPFMENNFMETHLPGVDVDRPIAELGGAFKDVIVETAQGSFNNALQGMKRIKFEVELTQTFNLDILLKVPHGGFQTGNLLNLVMEKPCPAFKFRKDLPISPPLMGSLQIVGNFELPYFFKTDASGEFRFTVKVDLRLKIKVDGSKAPTIEFKEPVVEITKHFSAQVGKVSLQVGARAIINKFFIGLCVGPVCTGPFAQATQALYVGFDAFIGNRENLVSGDGCSSEVVVKNKLETVFVDWEYPDAICTLDGTKSGNGFGAYLQIPKTQASVTMTTFDASKKKTGLSHVWHDFKVQKEIGEGDWHMEELFPPQCAGVNARLLVVNLKSAGNFAILAQSGINTISPSAIIGDVGISPMGQAGLVGFGLTDDSTDAATSRQVSGFVYAADMTGVTSTMAAAVLDMRAAYTAASTVAKADYIDRKSGELGGEKLLPGLYQFGTVVTISDDCTFYGSSADTWLIQIAGTLSIASKKKIILTGGALAENIVWVVAGAVSFGASSHFEGIVLGKTSATFKSGSTIYGRVLVQTAVSLDSTEITQPDSFY